MSAALSPVELDIIRNALVAAAEEMSVTVWRTSRSSVVRELLDYSTAVFDADGEGVAQAARMPVHLASMASCLSDILRDHAGRARPASLADSRVMGNRRTGRYHAADSAAAARVAF